MNLHSQPSVDEFAKMFDHTFLKPFGPPEDIEKLCAEARQYGFAMVAVHPAEVGRCVRLLAGSRVRTGAAIGFPLGQNTPAVKAYEMRDSIQHGAGEIDMVINLRALQAGELAIVAGEIEDMVAICHSAGIISKVILETCYLNDVQKQTVCRLAHSAGADFVKTSTGFGTAGATVEDIRLMRATVGPQMGVKASGGVRTLAQTLAMIEAGATRIGSSASVAIVEDYRARQMERGH